MGGGVGTVCGHGRPARGAESRSIEDGIVDIDQTVSDAVFDRR